MIRKLFASLRHYSEQIVLNHQVLWNGHGDFLFEKTIRHVSSIIVKFLMRNIWTSMKNVWNEIFIHSPKITNIILSVNYSKWEIKSIVVSVFHFIEKFYRYTLLENVHFSLFIHAFIFQEKRSYIGRGSMRLLHHLL